ncbi:MAG: methyltransferase domain-containing protein [Nitrospirae bacterium]|nr:methyltransferase domain-containing protein [Nitrospirota bacterium]
MIEKLAHIAANMHIRYRKYNYVRTGRIPWARGYTEYKYDFIGNIINSDDLTCFSSGKLPPGYGYRLDERAVEYPWFFSRLRNDEICILDAGSALNFKEVLTSNKMSGRKIFIVTLSHEQDLDVGFYPSYIYEDLRDLCFKADFFDAICSLSTIEHIGLDNTMLYTHDASKRENDKYAHLQAVREFCRVLKKGGTLYLSVPFGKHKNHGWFQIFDAEMINRVIETFCPAEVEKTFFKYEDEQWNFSDELNCRNSGYFDIHKEKTFEKDYLAASRSVCCVRMIK